MFLKEVYIKGRAKNMDFLKQKGKVSDVIKEKLKACGGRATVPSMCENRSGFEIVFTDMGIATKKLSNYVLEWEHFDEIVKKANSLGGKMYRGDANSGNKLGYGIPHDCVDGFVASELLGREDGKSVTRTSTYYTGVLEWAGIAKRHPAEKNVEASFIAVNEEYRNI